MTCTKTEPLNIRIPQQLGERLDSVTLYTGIGKQVLICKALDYLFSLDLDSVFSMLEARTVNELERGENK